MNRKFENIYQKMLLIFFYVHHKLPTLIFEKCQFPNIEKLVKIWLLFEMFGNKFTFVRFSGSVISYIGQIFRLTTAGKLVRLYDDNFLRTQTICEIIEKYSKACFIGAKNRMNGGKRKFFCIKSQFFRNSSYLKYN